MTEIAFNKYSRKGAYHWTEAFGPVHRINAFTLARYELVARLLTPAPTRGSQILDVGCGDGAMSAFLAKKLGVSVTGVDTDDLAIELATQQFKHHGLTGQFIRVDGYAYPFPDAGFDVVVSSDVIEHVRQPEALLREAWRVLRPGGHLVVTTPIRYTEAPLDPLHAAEWFPSQFRELCTGALGTDVNIVLSHPLGLTELYASGHPVVGRVTRLAVNILAKSGWNPFSAASGWRAYAAQAVWAIKPKK
jgi:2-polyprenyl-3-methyl-5-hydroxy-6-metoxy-1,4-benzoquinol methylase